MERTGGKTEGDKGVEEDNGDTVPGVLDGAKGDAFTERTLTGNGLRGQPQGVRTYWESPEEG